MKKTLFIVCAIALLSCKKEEKTEEPPPANGQCVIYSDDPSIGNWGILYQGTSPNYGTHGAQIGTVHYSAGTPNCGNTSYTTLDKPPGTYYVDFKSYDGFAWGNPKAIIITSGQCTSYNFH